MQAVLLVVPCSQSAMHMQGLCEFEKAASCCDAVDEVKENRRRKAITEGSKEVVLNNTGGFCFVVAGETARPLN